MSGFVLHSLSLLLKICQYFLPFLLFFMKSDPDKGLCPDAQRGLTFYQKDRLMSPWVFPRLCHPQK